MFTVNWRFILVCLFRKLANFSIRSWDYLISCLTRCNRFLLGSTAWLHWIINVYYNNDPTQILIMHLINPLRKNIYKFEELYAFYLHVFENSMANDHTRRIYGKVRRSYYHNSFLPKTTVLSLTNRCFFTNHHSFTVNIFVKIINQTTVQ